MKNVLPLALALLMLPAPARAGGSGVDVTFKKLLEPITWQWTEDDTAPRPVGAPRTDRTGATDVDALRLRFNVVCTGESTDCQDATLGVAYYPGAWSCTAPIVAPKRLGLGSAWQYADGHGQHGTPVSTLLLPRSMLPGIEIERQDPSIRLDFAVGQITEFDLSVATVRAHLQPNTRYVFMPHRVLDNGFADLRTCDAPTVCTRGGPPDFPAPPVTPGWTLSMPHAAGIDLVDFNDDNQIDILAGSILSAPTLFLNQGGANIQLAAGVMLHGIGDVTYNFGRSVAVDWDGDGDMDLLTGSHVGDVKLLINQGAAGFATPVSLARAPELGGGLIGVDDGLKDTLVDVMDWDGDGLPDLILGGKSGHVYLWRNPGVVDARTLVGREEVLFDGRPVSSLAQSVLTVPSVVDWDGDGLMDLLIASDGQNLHVARNAGTSTAPLFTALTEVDLPQMDMGGFLFPDVADVDGDGVRELVLGGFNGRIKVFRDGGQAGAPNYNTPVTPTVLAPPSAVSKAARVLWEEMGGPPAAPRRHDVLVILANGSLEAWLGVADEETPTYAVRVPVAQGVSTDSSPTVADLDQDGQPDLLLGMADGTVQFYRGILAPGWPRFETATPVKAGSTDVDVGFLSVPRVVDFNQDGRPDLLVGAGDGRVHLFPSGPSGLTSGGPLSAGGSVINVGAPASPAVVDFNDDRLPDLLVASANGAVSVALNSGEWGQPQLDALQPVQAQGSALQAGNGAYLVDGDWFALDCSEDIALVKDEQGSRQIMVYRGSIPTPPAPTGLVPPDHADDVAGTPIPVSPLLQWNKVSLPAGTRHRYEVELAERSDFAVVLHGLLTGQGSFQTDPATELTSPTLEDGRRYFWRVRAHDDLAHPGLWSVPTGFAVPREGHNPVDGELQSPDDSGMWVASHWAALKAPDHARTDLLEVDRIASLRELMLEEMGYVLRRSFVIRNVQLPGRLMVVASALPDGEQILVEAATGTNTWRQLGRFTGPMADRFFSLQATDIQSGTLTIRLRDIGPDNNQTTLLMDYVAVVPETLPPVANAGADLAVDEGTTATLDGRQTQQGDGTGVTFLWQQVSGTPTVALQNANTSVATFTAPAVTANISLTFQLTVTTTAGQSTDQVTVTIRDSANDPPEAHAGEDTAVDEGGSVALNGQGSSDPNGNTLTYAWQVVSSGMGTLDDPSSAQPRYTAPRVVADTQVVVRLTVSDGAEQDTDELTITVRNTLDESPLAAAGPDLEVLPGAPVTLDGQGSSDPNGDALTFQWAHTSGVAPEDLPTDLTQASISFHAPQLNAGQDQATMVFRLTVTAKGQQATDDVQVTVSRTVVDAGVPDAAQADGGQADASGVDAGAIQQEDGGAVEAVDGAGGGKGKKDTCACNNTHQEVPSGTVLAWLLAVVGFAHARKRGRPGR